MRADQLSSALQTPELHRQLLGDYAGAYSVGVGRDPEDPSSAVIVLQVEGDQPPNTPARLQIGSEWVRVITRPGFIVPKPLKL